MYFFSDLTKTLFHNITSCLSQGLYVIQDNMVLFVNDRLKDIFAIDTSLETTGLDFFRDVYPDFSTSLLFQEPHLRLQKTDLNSVSWGQPSARADGSLIWIEVEAHSFHLNSRRALLGFVKDVSECKVIGETMAASMQNLHNLLDAMEDRVYVVTDDYRIIYANRKMKEAMQGDYTGIPCYRAFRSREDQCGDCKRETFTSPSPLYWEMFNEEDQKWYSIIEIAINMAGETSPSKLVVARDITARIKAEDKIRTLSYSLLRAQETERGRISRELHDDLGQQLNAIKINLDILADDLNQEHESLGDQAKQIGENVENSIHCVRRLAAGLRPSFLGEKDIEKKIKHYCEKMTADTSLKLDWNSAGFKDLDIDETTSITLFRIIQEALNNVIKHAEASRVSIRIISCHPFIRAIIEDNGKGFDLEAFFAGSSLESSSHLGLVGMKERADLLGGGLTISSLAGRGTHLTAELPMKGG